jgi:hypothetical protein
MKPLKRFEFSLVAPRLEGFHFNVNRALERQIRLAESRAQREDWRSTSLLIVMLRFAWNSYEAVRYLTADIPSDPLRKATYVLVVPNINRQLLDVLFSLVYMLDDLMPRSLQYQKAGWRDLIEERDLYKSRFASDDEWQNHFENMEEQLTRLVDRFRITPEEQADPNLVDYWKTPFKLSKRDGPSRSFLEFMEKWIYKDVSNHSHLGFAGLQKVSSFLVEDLLGDAVQPQLQLRAMQSFHFQQVSRTAVMYLAIATEIDTYFSLGNHPDSDYLWIMFSEYVVEAQEIYDLRYRNRKR